MTALEQEVTRAIQNFVNYHSLENKFDLPDFAIAEMAMDHKGAGHYSDLSGEMVPFEHKSVREILLDSMRPAETPCGVEVEA